MTADVDFGSAGEGSSVGLAGGEEGTVSASVVVYGGDLRELKAALDSLAVAGARLPGGAAAVRLVLVDNGPSAPGRAEALAGLAGPWQGRVVAGQGNVGYGRGHNLAIERSASPFHLIMNPDVEVAPDALVQALGFLEAHPECGLLAPAVRDGDGALQYLCKRPPSVFDLLLRGFAPGWLRARFRSRIDRYELRDRINDREILWDPPIVSGCFMLFRTSVLKALGGFDPRYFLYFEDFDLSRRAAAVTRIAYVPAVRIVHHGGGAARKGPAHILMFARSALRYFATYGWRWV